MTETWPRLRIDGVTHRLGGADSTPVLHDVKLEIVAAQVIALAGRSGSGKSTLCHLVAGLDEPTSGRILLDGRPADQIDDWAVVSLLPQRLALVEELSIAENILLPTLLKSERRTSDEHPAALIEALGLSPLAAQRANQTSLGEQQRAALARTLVLRPRLAVLDEPTGHQDDEHVSLVLEALLAARDAGTAVLVATHDDRVLAIADQIIHLHQGRIATPPNPP